MALLHHIFLWTLIFSGIGFVDYCVTSLTLYSISRRRAIKLSFLSWIPFAKDWIYGCISDQYQKLVYRRIKYRRQILIGGNILTALSILGMRLYADQFEDSVTTAAYIIIGLIVFGVYVVRMIATKDLIASCTGKCSVWFFILLCLVGVIIRPVYFLIVFHNDRGFPINCEEINLQQNKSLQMDNSREKVGIAPLAVGCIILFPLFALLYTNYSYLWREPNFHTTTVENLPHYMFVEAPWGQPYYYIDGKESKIFARPVPNKYGWYYDPIERYDSFSALCREISAEVNQRVNERNIEEYGREKVFGDYHMRTSSVTSEIRERYGIEWHSKRELNPWIMID